MGFNMMVEISNNIICIIDTFHKFLCRLGIKWRWLCACYMCYITIWIYFEYIKYISIPFHQYANKSESPDTGIRSPDSPMKETCGLASYLVCRYVNLNVQEFANLYSLCNVLWCVFDLTSCVILLSGCLCSYLPALVFRCLVNIFDTIHIYYQIQNTNGTR